MNCTQCSAAQEADSVFCNKCGLRLAVSTAPLKENKPPRTIRIFLITGAVIMVIILIAFPLLCGGFFFGIQRARQKRTIGDIKTLASEVQTYKSVHGYYPVTVDIETLCKLLDMSNCIARDGWGTREHPQYFIYQPWGGLTDGCGKDKDTNDRATAKPASIPGLDDPFHKFIHEAMPDIDLSTDGCGPRHYGLASAGRDGKFEHLSLYEYRNHDAHSYDNDIVLVDGKFVQQPVGKQNSAPPE